MAINSILSDAGRAILDFALPPRCPGCGEIYGEQDRFCLSCWKKVNFLGGPCCARCGVPFELESIEGDELCEACHIQPPLWQSARAALAYGDVARLVAIRLKYGRRTGLARLMARYMRPHLVEVVENSRAKGEDILLVPVPLHRWRLWGRGFNQSALIARHLAKDTGCRADPFTLVRRKNTRPLRAMSPHKRAREVRDAFAVDPERAARVRGKVVVLIDDVHTSGATAKACTRRLLNAGATSVHVLCWARVLPEGGD